MPARLVELLGETLESASGVVATSSALAGKKVVALYFSARWSAACRDFTRHLSGWYTKDLQEKGVEVIFVSEDESEADFYDHFKGMPWLALSFGDQERQAALFKAFGFQKIPTLIMLDDGGKTITTKGVEVLADDPRGEDFPWRPKRVSELLAGARILGRDEREVSLQEVVSGKSAIALYFSALRCLRCQAFTERLRAWYIKDLESQGLQVVFVPCDEGQQDLQEHYAEMPWLTMDYSVRKACHSLTSSLRVEEVPFMVVLDSALRVVNRDGISAAQQDPMGKHLPWRRRPVNDMSYGLADMNDVRTVVAFCETQDAEQQAAIEETLRPFGERYLEKQQASGDDALLEFAFMVCTSADVGIGPEMRTVSDLPAVEVGETQPAILVLYDLPDNGGYYVAPPGTEITAASVEAFLFDVIEGSAIERRQLD